MALVLNKNAKREYEILKKYEAGIVLSGAEVKSLRQKKASLKGSFVKLIGNEAYLVNAQINPYSHATNPDYDPKRTRKLLLHRKQLDELIGQTSSSNRTVVPIAIYTKGKKIKVEIGLARGKKEYEKRAKLREKAIKRDLEREVKEKVRLR